MRFHIFILLFFISLSLVAQEKFILTDIQIDGNKITKDATVLRELSFKKGDTLSLQELTNKIEESKRNIEKQWLFNFIDFKYDLNPDLKITITTIERWYVWPYPIFEISERNFNVFYDSLKMSNFQDYSKLNYGVFLNVYNFRGRNEKLLLKYRKGYKEHYLFDYDIPYLNKKKTVGINLKIEFFRMKKFHFKTIANELDYFEQEGTFFKDFKKSIAVSYKPGLHSNHKFILENSEYNIPNSEILNNEQYLPNFDTNFVVNEFQYQFEYEKRNSISYPTVGSYHLAQLQIFKGWENSYKNIVFSAKKENHFKLNNKLLFGFSVKAKTSLKDSLAYIFNSSLGFEDYIRGYEYYVIDGNHFALSKKALKYCLVPKKKLEVPFFKMEQFEKSYYSLYLSIFADMGVVYDKYTNESNKLNNRFLYSQGIGLDFVTYYDKLMRLELSRNHLKEWGVFLHFSNPF
jgi:outer membrane protein assembly factor BamA